MLRSSLDVLVFRGLPGCGVKRVGQWVVKPSVGLPGTDGGGRWGFPSSSTEFSVCCLLTYPSSGQKGVQMSSCGRRGVVV